MFRDRDRCVPGQREGELLKSCYRSVVGADVRSVDCICTLPLLFAEHAVGYLTRPSPLPAMKVLVVAVAVLSVVSAFDRTEEWEAWKKVRETYARPARSLASAA